MYSDYKGQDIDIDGRDSNGNQVGGYGGSCYGRNDGYDNHSYHYEEPAPRYEYQFKTEEELINSEIFQNHLGKSLAHKDRTIRDLQNELLKRE